MEIPFAGKEEHAQWLDKNQVEYLVRRGGFEFKTDDPTNSVNVTLRRLAEDDLCEAHGGKGSRAIKYRFKKEREPNAVTTFMAHGEGIQQVESADSAQIPTGWAVRSRGAHFRRMGHGRLLRKAGPGAAHRPLADQRRPPPRRTAGGRDHGRLRGAPVGTRSESHRTEPADRGRSGDHRRGKLEFTSTRSEPRADITMAIDGMPQVPPGGGARRISPNSWM